MVMRPTFGCALNQFLFEFVDTITTNLIKQTIETALIDQEPRIDQLFVDVKPLPDQNTYNIAVYFNIKVVQTQQSINFSLNQIR